MHVHSYSRLFSMQSVHPSSASLQSWTRPVIVVREQRDEYAALSGFTVNTESVGGECVQPVNPLIYVPVGLVLSAAIGLLAYRRGSLARSGVLGAVLTGTLHFGFGGLTWGLTLIAFFISSTLLGKFRAHEKESIARQYAKGGQRDFGQTLANGGAGAALAVAFALHPTAWLFAAFVGATATVNADTWATELGPLSRRPPQLLTTGRVVPPGTSGGVTVLGTAAALAGAMLIGFVAWGLAALFGAGSVAAWVPLVGAIAGLGGALADSVLGATLQAQYQDATGAVTEQAGVTRVRGLRWMTNDAVNFLASLMGASIGALLGRVFA